MNLKDASKDFYSRYRFQNSFKDQILPLARIKKIMKMDDDVKMISAEAPLLFAKAAQMFITGDGGLMGSFQCGMV